MCVGFFFSWSSVTLTCLWRALVRMIYCLSFNQSSLLTDQRVCYSSVSYDIALIADWVKTPIPTSSFTLVFVGVALWMREEGTPESASWKWQKKKTTWVVRADVCGETCMKAVHDGEADEEDDGRHMLGGNQRHPPRWRWINFECSSGCCGQDSIQYCCFSKYVHFTWTLNMDHAY